MRIEVSVPGIRKERGKLLAPTTLGALRLGLPLAAGPLICAELAGPALREPVTSTSFPKFRTYRSGGEIDFVAPSMDNRVAI